LPHFKNLIINIFCKNLNLLILVLIFYFEKLIILKLWHLSWVIVKGESRLILCNSESIAQTHWIKIMDKRKNYLSSSITNNLFRTHKLIRIFMRRRKTFKEINSKGKRKNIRIMLRTIMTDSRLKSIKGTLSLIICLKMSWKEDKHTSSILTDRRSRTTQN